jgi:hypothetical protein
VSSAFVQDRRQEEQQSFSPSGTFRAEPATIVNTPRQSMVFETSVRVETLSERQTQILGRSTPESRQRVVLGRDDIDRVLAAAGTANWDSPVHLDGGAGGRTSDGGVRVADLVQTAPDPANLRSVHQPQPPMRTTTAAPVTASGTSVAQKQVMSQVSYLTKIVTVH